MTQIRCAVAPQHQPVPLRSYELPTYFSVVDVLRNEAGDDPISVLYPRRIAAAARTFVTGFPGKVMYAVKANPHPAIIQMLWDSGVRRFDVASLREVELAHDLLPDAELFLMHPVKSQALISRAYALGVRNFAFDCAAELEKIIGCTAQAADLNLFLRLGLPASDAKMPLSGKFGANFQDAISVLPEARRVAARLGVCFHVGSQCMTPGSYDTAIAYARQVANTAGVELDSLDVGGGFPVSYPDMPIPPMSDYFAVIESSLKTYGFAGLDILGEPGRALCAEGGSTLARIELRKGEDLYLNDGTYGSLFDAGSFAWRFPVLLHRDGVPLPSDNTIGFRFFGPTCDSVDVMAGPFHLPADAREGDWIEIAHLGAYGQALATRFNGFYATKTVSVFEIDLSPFVSEDAS